jgi:predicted transposase/invertase (TIGR01784 family)
MHEETSNAAPSAIPQELLELMYPVRPFINPFIDECFKKIFASETSKEILRAFLNEVLKDALKKNRYIQSITYGKNEYPGDSKQEAKAVFDVICTDESGATFLVEVQSLEQDNFKERLLYYASRLISDRAPKGDKDWKYHLKEVYVIALMENFCLPDSNPNVYLHDICLCNRHTGKVFYDKLDFICIEMPSFVKEKDELVTPLDQWLYALKHAPEMEEQPIFLKTPEIDHFFDLARYSNFTEGERNMYRTAQQVRWDNQNALDFAKNKARKSGHEEGLAEGLEQGLEQGLAEGRQEGDIKATQRERAKAEKEKKEMAVKLALEMLADQEPLEKIARYTKLSIKEIQTL